jgi:phosphoribosylanthranilate isomerase
VKVKICGLFRHEDIEIVNEHKPDYIGFVFANSRRQVTPQQALQLRKFLCPQIIPVGVFVDTQFAEQYRRNGVFDIIQTPSHVGEYLMFDGPNPGSGKTFDWDTIPQTNEDFFLAGGLTPENVASAIARTRPFAVDVSSGVETNGYKDAVKIARFIKQAKNQ